MKMAAQEHRFGIGLICGTLPDGRRAYTNGHLLLVGKPPRNSKQCEFPKGFLCQWDVMVPSARLAPARKKSKKHFATKKPYTVIVFHDGTGADEEYLNEIKRKFPRSKLFLGRKADETNQYLVAKQDDVIVALLAPMRWR